MADWTSRIVTTVTKEYSLPSPTNWAEVSKVLSAIDRELPESRRHGDDTVTVTAHDDEILFTYVMKNESS
jgi:hypothetical protein